VVTRQLQAERRTGSVRRPKTGVPPTALRNQAVSSVYAAIIGAAIVRGPMRIGL